MYTSFRLLRTKYFLGLTIFSGIVILTFYTHEIRTLVKRHWTVLERWEWSDGDVTEFQYDENFSGVDTPGCKIPNMNAWDDSIKSYVFEEMPIKCDAQKPPLVDSINNTLYIIHANFKEYNITDADSLKCYYNPFRRVDPQNNARDFAIEYDKNKYEIQDKAAVGRNEFVKVFCNYKDKEIYKDFFDFVPLKNATKRAKGDDALNVLVVGIDSISRLNFIRQMPKTYDLLRQLNSVDMLGFNKIGDNSFPNQVPILTGLTIDDIKEVCWPNSSTYFDKCPLIWNDFKQQGYTTAFAEDTAWMGLFHYQAHGFLKQPTDYYWDPFNVVTEKQIGNAHSLNVDDCFGSRLSYLYLVNYITRFAEVMRNADQKYFAYFWGSSISHDYLNRPKFADEDYYKLIRGFNESGVLNNTALIFMSDHGIRWGAIRSTYQGNMEERLPYLEVILPEWFTKKHPQLYANLKTNRNRLTTPLDLHETLKDLLHPNKLTDALLKQRAGNTTKRRSYSLFDKISNRRTCDDAGITSHWCTCQVSQEISPSSEIVLRMANYMVDNYINAMLKNSTQCAILKLDEIISARTVVDTQASSKNTVEIDYSVNFRTMPGGGVFEGTVKKIDNILKVTGTISRINLYGNQSACVSNKLHKLYCYCI